MVVSMSKPASIPIPPALAQIAAGRDHITTPETAKAFNRKPQTVRKWACNGEGPVRPIRVNGRLLWPVADIATVLAGGE